MQHMFIHTLTHKHTYMYIHVHACYIIMYMYLEVAGPEFPGVCQLHNGYKTTGEQSLYDTHLSSLCQGGTTESGDGGGGGGRRGLREREKQISSSTSYITLFPGSPPVPCDNFYL